MNFRLDKLIYIYFFIKKQLDNDLYSDYFKYIILKRSFLYMFLLSPQRKSALRQMHGT